MRVEKNSIVSVRGDRDNPVSRGYACRKGLRIMHHQHHGDRLTHPLKRDGGGFKKISYDRAFDEIAEKLSGLTKRHGPRSLALVGGGSIGCALQGIFAVNLLRGLGSQYFYNALGQELTGRYWVDGKVFGSEALHLSPHLDRSDTLLAVGWNPMMSHHTPRARRVLTRFAADPDRVLVVVDPRLSETARIADIHLPLRPGTDALLYRAMISIILEEGWHDRAYIDRHVRGFERISPFFTGFEAKDAVDVCELDYDTVKEVCRLFATRRSSLRSDLGVLMNRHSTLVSYLETVLMAVCGRIGGDGGNIFPVSLRGGPKKKTASAEVRGHGYWRTLATDYPGITRVYPPNVLPEEIMSDYPDRLRAVIVSGANPLRSFADTSAYEEAFGRLDLLVTIDIAMTETAALSHYVLPALSAYESWDAGLTLWEGGFPELFMQVRHPVLEPEGEQMEAGQIFLCLAERLNLVPEIPGSLYDAARNSDRPKFTAALLEYLNSYPEARRNLAYVLGKTLGKSLRSVQLASFWGSLQNLPPQAHELAARAGFHPGPGLGEELFQAILDHPEGIRAGKVETETHDHFRALATDDGRINLHVPELTEWICEIEPAAERERLREGEGKYPFILSSGRHMDFNANTQMRDPAWNRGKRACTVIMHPGDAEGLGLCDGQMVRISTDAGEATVELQVTSSTRPGYIMIPHGFGLVFRGEEYGVNANRLTSNTHRDRLAGTPYHRYIRCRVEAA